MCRTGPHLPTNKELVGPKYSSAEKCWETRSKPNQFLSHSPQLLLLYNLNLSLNLPPLDKKRVWIWQGSSGLLPLVRVMGHIHIQLSLINLWLHGMVARVPDCDFSCENSARGIWWGGPHACMSTGNLPPSCHLCAALVPTSLLLAFPISTYLAAIPWVGTRSPGSAQSQIPIFFS